MSWILEHCSCASSSMLTITPYPEGLSTSPSADHLYSNLWVWSTCRVVTWIRTGLGTGSPDPRMITYRLPVCICACPNLHDGPMLPPGRTYLINNPQDALSECLVCICSEHHAGDYFTFLLCSSPFVPSSLQTLFPIVPPHCK